MMTFRQYLLQKLAEECNGAAQRALKQSQFGRSEIQPGQAFENAIRLQHELWDIDFWVRQLRAFEELRTSNCLEDTRLNYMHNKYAKAQQYLELAQKLGTVKRGTLLR